MATRKSTTGKTNSVKNKKKISLDIIRKRAHEIYLNRIKKGTPGDADSDWQQAQNELMN